MMEALRQQLNSLDDWIIRLLGRRFETCCAIGRYKREHGIPMMQPARVAEVKERCARIAIEHGVDPDFARRLYCMIIDEACRLEDEIMEREREMQSEPDRVSDP
jgi:chorismate mutase-like protein